MRYFKSHRHLAIVAMMLAVFSAWGAGAVKMKNPWIDNPNTSKLFIDAVELGPDSTIVTLRTYCYMNQNINIQPGVKLFHDGKSYDLRSANGIELGKRIKVPAFGDSTFTLSFAPLPIDTKVFDFIEGDGDYDFRLLGVHTDKSFDSQTPLDQLNELPQQKWEKGTAVLKGKIINYQPSDELSSVEVYPRSALGRQIDTSIGSAPVDSDGTFVVELPLFQSYQSCFFKAPGFYGLIYLSPDKESYVTIDQAQRISNGHVGKDGSVMFSGANDELNNQLALNIGHDMVWDAFLNNRPREKNYTSSTEYKEDVMRHKTNIKEKIKRLPFTPKMKHLMNVIADNDMMCSLSSRFETQNFVEIDPTYYDFYNQIDIDDPEMLWAEDFDSFVNSAYNPYNDNLPISTTSTPVQLYTYLIENNIATGEDAELAKSLISHHIDNIPHEIVEEYARAAVERIQYYCDSLNLQGSERASAEKLINKLNSGEINNYNRVTSHYMSWIFNLIQSGHKLSFQGAMIPFENETVAATYSFFEENDSIISTFKNKYEDNANEWKLENDIDNAINNFTKIYGKESQIMNKLFATYAYNTNIEKRNTLSENYIANCRKRLPDIFFDYVMVQNDAMAKVLQRVNSNVLEMEPENSGDEVLKEIAETHKGKVIYIDIWATWCSPCLNAITEIQPVKKDYADSVAFVYLADQSSPKKAWDEKIESIEGDHMRLSQEQMQDIMNRFAFNGYPSYIVIGKDGSIAFSGHLHGLSNIKKILDEEIAK